MTAAEFARMTVLLVLRAIFTASSMSASSFHLIAIVRATQGKSTHLSTSVGLLTGPGNSAGVVLSWADSRPTVTIRICLLTLCHILTCVPNTTAATTITMVWAGHAGMSVAVLLWGVAAAFGCVGGVRYVLAGVSAKDVRDAKGADGR